MHDTFSSHHANVFWREIQTCPHPNTLKMNHVNKQHFTSLFSYGISCWLSMQKCTLYLSCFLVAEFLITYAWQFISCHANGFGGKFKKNFTSLWNLLLISMQKKSRDLSIMLFSGGSTRTDWLSVGTLRCTFVQVLVITWTRLNTVTEITNYCPKIIKYFCLFDY